MSAYSSRPKVQDGVILAGTVCLMGAPTTFPQINHTLGLVLFWAGLLGVFCYPAWRWGLHFVFADAPPAWWPFGRVPIQDAALQLYEAAEKADALEYMIADGPSPLYKLETFKYVMMVDDGVVLYGAKPPSRQPRPIPHLEARKSLRPIEGTSQLNHGTPYDKVAYTEVTISRKDLRRLKREWPIQAKAWAQQFKNG